MPPSQATLDRVRRLNKRITNKILIHICGRSFGHFAILRHVGRKSGQQYQIPIIAEPVENGFVFAMTYGKKVDWYANVKASGGCSLFWKGESYALVNPQIISKEQGLLAFPPILRRALTAAGIEYFLKLDRQ